MGEKKQPIKFESWMSKVIEDFGNFSTEEKIVALDRIIDACEAAELKYLSDRLEIFLKRDFVRFLPTELGLYLLSWLDPVSLGRCCLVSKTWNEAVRNCQPAWIRACKSIGWKVDESVTTGNYWKKAYQRALVRLKQLKSGSAFEISTLMGHTARVYTVRYDGRELLASGSDDRSVRLWDVMTGECLQVIRTHTCADLAFDQYCVYTASFDNTIACWDWISGDLVRSYRGHTGAVFSLSYDSERDLLVSGSADKTVRLWQLSTARQINMYHGHHEWVTKVLLRRCSVESLHHKPGDLVVFSMDKIEIRIWPISKEVNCICLCVLSANDDNKKQDFSYPSYSSQGDDVDENPEHWFLHPQLLFDGATILCSSERGILEWDFRDYTLIRVTPHTNDPTFLLGVGKRMFLTADTRENCLLIRMNDSDTEPQPLYSSTKEVKGENVVTRITVPLSPSPETVDYEDEQELVNKPSTSNPVSINRRLDLSTSTQVNHADVRVTPSAEEDVDDNEPPGGQNANVEDELVNDFNCNNIKVFKNRPHDGAVSNGPVNNEGHCSQSECHITDVLGRCDLPLCRWSKRGSNYACGDSSWLNGFSDISHSGLVFAAALPDHSIYILKWSECG